MELRGILRENKEIQELLRNISEHLKCPNCGSLYDVSNVNYLGKIQAFYVLQLFCTRCGIPVFASVLVRDGRKRLITNPIPSELTKSDLIRISQAQISSDRVLEFANFMKNYNGSLSSLLK